LLLETKYGRLPGVDSIRKILAVGSYYFGAKAIEDVLHSCLHLEELSIKHLCSLAKLELIAISSPRLPVSVAQGALQQPVLLLFDHPVTQP